MPPTSKLRRIFQALSVLSATACVLLIVLWVRSYYARDGIRGVARGNFVLLSSLRGKLTVAITDWTNPQIPWTLESTTETWKMRSVYPAVTGTLPLTNLGFRWKFAASFVVVVLPYWFLATLATAPAIAPWITFRYSLRALLIATTLVAVVLGTVTWAAS